MAWLCLRELWGYFTYEHYGRRRLRPSTYAVILGLAMAGGMLLAGVILSGTAPGGQAPRPAPTLPPPTWTAVLATGTAMAARPTSTPAPACPPNPAQWQLVPVQPFLDPQTGRPLELPKPLHRLQPPCVYEGLWRDLAYELFLRYTKADIPPAALKMFEIPWYWDPGPEVSRRLVGIAIPTRDFTFYDRSGRRIDEVLTVYTVAFTGDPDYPVAAYVYRDSPGAAYWVQWRGRWAGGPEGHIGGIYPVRLQGGSTLRRIEVMLYHPGVQRWYHWRFKDKAPPRAIHAVEGDGSSLWGVVTVPGARRSELARTFGYPEFFPERIDLSAHEMRETLTFGP